MTLLYFDAERMTLVLLDYTLTTLGLIIFSHTHKKAASYAIRWHHQLPEYSTRLNIGKAKTKTSV
jgi:hypothetical protein